MGFSRHKPIVRPVTKADIERFSTMQRLPMQTDVFDARLVQSYERARDDGTFRNFNWAFAACKADGQEYLLNGDHTSKMAANSTLDQLAGMFVTVEGFDCDTFKDVCELYRDYDPPEQSRNKRQVIATIQAAIPQLRNVNLELLMVAVPAISAVVLHTTKHGARITMRNKASLLFDHYEDALFLETCFPGSRHNWEDMGKNAIFQGILLIRKFHSGELAKKFAVLVRDASGLDPQSADRQFAKYLASKPTAIHVSNGKNDQNVGQEEMLMRTLHAFDEWKAGTNRRFPLAKSIGKRIRLYEKLTRKYVPSKLLGQGTKATKSPVAA